MLKRFFFAIVPWKCSAAIAAGGDGRAPLDATGLTHMLRPDLLRVPKLELKLRQRSAQGEREGVLTMQKPRRVPSSPLTGPLGREIDDEAADPGTDGEPLDAAIARVLAELGGDADASINVYRVRPGRRDGEFIEAFDPHAFDGEASFLRRLRDDFGAGEYRIQLRDGSKFRINRTVHIAPARDRPRSEHADGIAAAVTALIADQGKRHEELLRVLTTSAQRPADSDDAVLQRLKLMRDVFGAPGGGSRGGGSADAIEHFLRGLTLGRSLEPQNGAGTSDVLLETVKAFGPALVRAVQLGDKRRALPAKPKPAPAASPAPAIPAGGDPAPAPGGGVTPEIQKLLDLLIAAAARDAEPELYAEVVLDQVGPEQLAQLATMGDLAALLAGLDARVHEHMEWFIELRTALEAQLANEAQNAADGAGAGTGGSDADATAHGRPH